MTTVFQTDTEGYLVGSVKADPDPRIKGAWLIPRGCVTALPPALSANEAAKWNGSAWEKVPDFRGRVYWLADGSRHEITKRGILVPQGALDTEPPPTPEQLAAEAAQAALIAHRADVKADAFVQQFVDMTPVQVVAYINANVSNLADAKQLLTKFGLILLLVAKDQFK